MSCTYISFDQSSTATGYCIWLDGQYQSHGLINHKKIKEADLRFDAMSKDIVALLNEIKPQVVTIEDTALQTNAKTLKDLSQLQGVIIGYCLSHDISFSIYSPSKWRSLLQFNTGSGIKRPQLKQQAMDYVYEHFGINATEDEAEAICIGAAVLSQF